MGKPTEDGLIEVSNARLRSKSLNVNWLMSIEDARQKVETWRRNYNKDRPQSALANLSPREFAASRAQPAATTGTGRSTRLCDTPSRLSTLRCMTDALMPKA